VKRLLSSDHFSVDGTLIEAWASMKSFRPKDGSGSEPPAGGGRNAEANVRGEKRSNETQASTTDPDARLYRKADGQPALLCHMGHALMENRHGLVVGSLVTRAASPRPGSAGQAGRRLHAHGVVAHSNTIFMGCSGSPPTASLSPYFFGASFEAAHLRASTCKRAKLASVAWSAIWMISSLRRSA
jgi:hypothetical protein